MALPPKFDAGDIRRHRISHGEKFPALALPVLVDTFTRPVVAVVGTVNTSCVVLALVMVAGTPFTVMVLLIAVALNPVPTIVTLDPTVPLEGVMLEINGAAPRSWGVNTITGSSCVCRSWRQMTHHDKNQSYPLLPPPVVKEYGYDTSYVIVCGPNFAVLEL